MLTAAMSVSLGAPVPLAGRSAAQTSSADDMSRLKQAAMLNDLNARLLSGRSATHTLEEWCVAHGLAPVGIITADRIIGEDKPITAEQRARLKISADEPVRYRRVRLKCGAAVLSEADNWYIPARLTDGMNDALDKSDAPFGRIVEPLGISRHTMSAKILWDPLENASARIPDFIIEQRALVLDRGMNPISEVVETYTKENLAFPALSER